MLFLVLVKFLPGGSLSPEEFFSRIHASWSWIDPVNEQSTLDRPENLLTHSSNVKSAMCIAELESIEQLAIDVAIMPGAGISNIEVVPIPTEKEQKPVFISTQKVY